MSPEQALTAAQAAVAAASQAMAELPGTDRQQVNTADPDSRI